MVESEGTKVQNSHSPLLCCNLDSSDLLILMSGAVFFSAPSRLPLLCVNKRTHHEAIPVLYSYDLVFEDCATLRNFLGWIPTYLKQITELTITFKTTGANAAFTTITNNCINLQRLDLDLDLVLGTGITFTKDKPRCLQYAVGMKGLRLICGIRQVSLIGKDLSPNGDYLPLTDERTIGPQLLRDLCCPRPKLVHEVVEVGSS